MSNNYNKTVPVNAKLDDSSISTPTYSQLSPNNVNQNTTIYYNNNVGNQKGIQQPVHSSFQPTSTINNNNVKKNIIINSDKNIANFQSTQQQMQDVIKQPSLHSIGKFNGNTSNTNLGYSSLQPQLVQNNFNDNNNVSLLKVDNSLYLEQQQQQYLIDQEKELIQKQQQQQQQLLMEQEKQLLELKRLQQQYNSNLNENSQQFILSPSSLQQQQQEEEIAPVTSLLQLNNKRSFLTSSNPTYNVDQTNLLQQLQNMKKEQEELEERNRQAELFEKEKQERELREMENKIRLEKEELEERIKQQQILQQNLIQRQLIKEQQDRERELLLKNENSNNNNNTNNNTDITKKEEDNGFVMPQRIVTIKTQQIDQTNEHNRIEDENKKRLNLTALLSTTLEPEVKGYDKYDEL